MTRRSRAEWWWRTCWWTDGCAQLLWWWSTGNKEAGRYRLLQGFKRLIYLAFPRLNLLYVPRYLHWFAISHLIISDISLGYLSQDTLLRYYVCLLIAVYTFQISNDRYIASTGHFLYLSLSLILTWISYWVVAFGEDWNLKIENLILSIRGSPQVAHKNSFSLS